MECAKQQYSKAEADRMKKAIGSGSKGKAMRIYQCPECWGYHLTKKYGRNRRMDGIKE